ncbi:MAG: hypothetical protein WCK86_01110 [Planctomycetia bacterium]
MQGCLAPSEIPGVSSQDASVFGAVAEDIIYADFHSKYAGGTYELFRDANNPSSYLLFLARNNPQFSQTMQEDYYRRLRVEQLMRIPDFLVHKPAEQAFYEVKPDSPSGMAAGIEKVGTLRAVYTYYQLPYAAGSVFTPRNHTLASLGAALQVTMRVRRAADGLLVYRICLDSEGIIQLALLALILRLVVRYVNQQKGKGRFQPIDLQPVLSRLQLSDLARDLGLTAAAAAGAVAAKASWRHFWKAVVARFAVRGAAAATLAAADGPLPVGDLISVGLALWTIVDIVRFNDELWRDAEVIARQGA